MKLDDVIDTSDLILPVASFTRMIDGLHVVIGKPLIPPPDWPPSFYIAETRDLIRWEELITDEAEHERA